MADPKINDTGDFVVQRPVMDHGLSSLVRVDVAGLSHVGHVRPNNEDHFLITRFGRFLEALDTNLPSDLCPQMLQESGYAMVVADGMGGHAAGEEASKLAITTLVKLALTTPDWILRLDDEAYVEATERRAAERFAQIDRVMAERAAEDPGLKDFGTTLTYAASLGHDLFVAHVGDSRAYLLHDGTLRQLTHDHSLAQGLADAGRIRQEEVATHRFKHVLQRVLGRATSSQPDICQAWLDDGDRLLLCSDGLTDMIGDAVIAEILSAGTRAQATCAALVGRALTAGGKDNVTVVVAAYQFPTEVG